MKRYIQETIEGIATHFDRTSGTWIDLTVGVSCPDCGAFLEMDYDENQNRTATCPECGYSAWIEVYGRND